MLTKHCSSCGRNLGINYYYVNEDGSWNEMCKLCESQKTKTSS